MTDSYPLADYAKFSQDILAEIRRETFGEDIGQFSWITADEYRKFLGWLQLERGSTLLDFACGSGGLSLYAAQSSECHVIGMDLSKEAIATASYAAAEKHLDARASFVNADGSQPLPIDDNSVDAIISIDAMNHFKNKDAALTEWMRVLRPGGRFVFTDAAIVSGPLNRSEILVRSSGMGDFFFTPVGYYDHVIQELGFIDCKSEDVTSTIALTAGKWQDARAPRRQPLLDAKALNNLKKCNACSRPHRNWHRMGGC